MRLQYAGYIFEDVGLTTPYEMEAVFRGPDYLYTRHRISIRAVLHPLATSVNASGVNNAGIAGQLPAETLENIRLKLMQPRQNLLFLVGPSTSGGQLVCSPPPGFSCDANNGPIPLRCHVVNWIGFRTALVDFTIETYVRDFLSPSVGPLPGGPVGPALLSHRWAMTQDIDEDYKTTRTISGQAIFRTDAMQSLNSTPDNWRGIINFPIPNFWKRESVKVALNEDNNTLDYEIVDKEYYVLQTNANVTRVDAHMTYQGSRSNAAFAASAVLSKIIGALGDIATAYAFGRGFSKGAATPTKTPSMPKPSARAPHRGRRGTP